ncbi:enoyl-[acyl-carrier-protein] reductase, mitochondrial-like [Oscarella lobularis]|uniref:enoyl-[acyl-carrier-protein] reductase, mitochondrial-like n=1 Tax=Oscarella lobularis TaxID=121494 RepID=UPI0033144215
MACMIRAVARRLSRQRFGVRFSSISSVVYERYGNPEEVLQLQTEDAIQPKADEIAFQMLAAPINPADINMIQGTYGMKATFPAIAGNEGVGRITAIGSSVTSKIKIGDHFVPNRPFWGTWRSGGVCPANDILIVPNDISPVSMSMMFVNPTTAYRMLEDFETLNEGDVVIQNGSNSGVGQAVIQIAAARNLKTINVIRARPDLIEITDYLTSLGATEVVTEEFAQSRKLRELIQTMGKPKLALNCVGGKSATALLQNLQQSGTMVTYGGMSRRPISVGTGMMIFSDLKLCGYWQSRWNDSNANSPALTKMLEDLYALVRADKLKMPRHEPRALSEFQEAVKKAWEPMTTTKQVFSMVR